MRGRARARTRRRSRLIEPWALLAVVAVGGCAALPDVSPFATASTQLAAAVKTSGTAISEDLHASPDFQAHAQQFDRAWVARNEAMRAVVSYSDGLVGIVKATGDARASARALADKVGTLAQAAGVVQPGAGAAADIAADTAAFIWAQIALMKGAASLEDALAHAQPAIERLTDILTRDTRDLASIVRGVALSQRTTLAARYNEAAGYADGLTKRRAELRGKAYASLTGDEVAELGRLDALLAPPNAELQKREEHTTKIDRREKASLQLLAATRESMDRWAAAHKDVVLAVQQRRAVNVESLADAAVELRDLVKRIREL